jgi:hypothetical protein
LNVGAVYWPTSRTPPVCVFREKLESYQTEDDIVRRVWRVIEFLPPHGLAEVEALLMHLEVVLVDLGGPHLYRMRCGSCEYRSEGVRLVGRFDFIGEETSVPSP